MIRALGWVFAIGLGTELAGCEVLPPSEDQVRADVAAETDQARRLMLLETHVKRNTDSASAHLWLARAYRERDDARAVHEYERAASLDPNDSIARVELGYLSIERDLRRGRVPDPASLEVAERWVREAWTLNESCERRHDLIGIFELQLDAVKAGLPVTLSTDAATVVRDGMSRCASDARWIPPWSATFGRIEASKGRLQEAARWACAAVAAGHAPAIADCTKAGGEALCGALQSGEGKLFSSSAIKAKFFKSLASCDSARPPLRGTVGK